MQCKGITVQGNRCKLQTNNEYCRFHRANNTPDGYIYAYTLWSFENAEVYNHNKQRFEPINTRGIRKLLFWRKPTRQVLIKVGYTTIEPADRIDQWQRQCGHPLKLICPSSRAAPHFDTNHQGWRCRNPHSTEKAIHNKLHAQFGRGKVQCSCKQGRGIHVEWFLVPKNRLKDAIKIIDQIISI